MKIILTLILFSAAFLSCTDEIMEIKKSYLVNEIPKDLPIDFKSDLIPANKLIHKGTFSPDLSEYYYIISDKDFEKFSVFVINKRDGKWSEPKRAFFDSEYSEHGMSFSPDGNSIFFSSTRPVNIEGVSSTWHIWKTEKVNGIWTEALFVDIPNLRNKLVSHPTITNSGKLYFHSSNLDYSEMAVYHSQLKDGLYEDARKTIISSPSKIGTCTPYVSPEEDYLIFASIGDQLDLMISFSDGNGGWINTKKLNTKINILGQGNPYVTPDNRFLFFTTGDHSGKDWKVNWVDIQSELEYDL